MTVPQPRAERVRQVSDGLYYLLIDDQDRPGGPVEVRYSRMAYKVTDRTGLESAAAINVSFDPATENVVLHHVAVWRSGRASDRLAGADVQVIRREKQLDKGILDGRKTAHLELKDIQVGDVVDYAYSIENTDPLRLQSYAGEASTSWSTPAALTHYRVLWPHNLPITIARFAGAPAPQVRHLGDRDEYDWRVMDPAPIQKDEKAPEWVSPWGRVVVSSMNSWRQVVDWSLPLYRASPLPPAWTGKVDEIARRFPDPRDRITEALRLVQDDIRYVSLSMGLNSYQPRPPAEVVRTGYGDCKDKAVLLTAVLNRLGIAAAPALTDTDKGPALAYEPPRTDAFNHAIVRIELGGKTYWVDPTASKQGGRFPDLTPISTAWALPIRPGQSGLEAIPRPAPAAPTIEVAEHYSLPHGPRQDLTLRVTSIYRGSDADDMRGDVANRSPAELEKRYLDYYAGKYPGLRRERDLVVEDQRDANLLTIREAYVIPAAALLRNELNKAFPVSASSVDIYKRPPEGERHLPLLNAYPLNTRHQIILQTPGVRPPAPSDVEIKDKSFEFARHAQRDGDVLTITETLVGRRELTPANEVDTLRTDIVSLQNSIDVTLDLTSTKGGVIGRGERVAVYAVLIGGALLLLIGAFFGVRSALAADAAYASEGKFYPVSLAKFVLMCAATAGLYPMFWRWKHWRWAKRHDGQDIQPFWRSLFSVFWLWPLFEQPNSRLGDRALPAGLGIAAAAVYLLWSVGDSAVNRWTDAPVWLRLAGLGIFICNLPAVIAVVRLNGPDSPVLRANSRLTWHTGLALAFGVIFWALYIIGLSQ